MRSDLFRRTRLSVSLSLLMAALLTACGGGAAETDSAPSAAAATDTQAAPVETVSLAPASGSTTATTVAAAPAATVSPAAADPAPAVATSTDSPTAAATAAATVTASATTSATDRLPSGSSVLTGTGAASLSWVAPATEANGASVGSLAGYRIYFGKSSGKYAGSLYVSGSIAVSGTINGLTTGKWYFTVAAVDIAGNESNFGYEMSKTL